MHHHLWKYLPVWLWDFLGIYTGHRCCTLYWDVLGSSLHSLHLVTCLVRWMQSSLIAELSVASKLSFRSAFSSHLSHLSLWANLSVFHVVQVCHLLSWFLLFFAGFPRGLGVTPSLHCEEPSCVGIIGFHLLLQLGCYNSMVSGRTYMHWWQIFSFHSAGSPGSALLSVVTWFWHMPLWPFMIGMVVVSYTGRLIERWPFPMVMKVFVFFFIFCTQLFTLFFLCNSWSTCRPQTTVGKNILSRIFELFWRKYCICTIYFFTIVQ